MNTTSKKLFIINILYYSLILFLTILFIKFILFEIFPFIFGFLIAFILHNAVKKTYTLLPISKKILASIYLILFYSLCILIIGFILIQCILFMIKCIDLFPNLYKNYLQPFLFDQMEFLSTHSHSPFLQLLQPFFLQIQTFLYEFIVSHSTSIIAFLSNFISKLPSFFISFFLTILISIFTTFDFHKIIAFIKKQIPAKQWNTLYQIHKIVIETLQNYCIVYIKLLLFTWLQLFIGFFILKIDHALIKAFIIACFDVLPLVGIGIILIPWIIFAFMIQQKKLAVGLLILYLTINLIRQIIEPKLIGKQFGIHPLLLLFSMYLGLHYFGFLGVLCMPIILQILKRINQANILFIYKE